MARNLWITCAWADNTEGDFDYLVTELNRGGVTAKFDRIALIPGQRLWEQIAGSIASDDLGGWSYLLTPHSIASQPCLEELAYAIDRTLSKKGAGFPLIGLLHGVPISAVPAALRVRLCVDLKSPTWIEAVRGALDQRPPVSEPSDLVPFKARIHNTYLGKSSLKAVEFVPRFGELRYWRIAYPTLEPKAVIRGVGPAGGGGVSGVYRDFVEGTVDINGIHMLFFGLGDPISPSTAAYIGFESALPSDIAFGWCNEPYGTPSQWWPMKLS